MPLRVIRKPWFLGCAVAGIGLAMSVLLNVHLRALEDRQLEVEFEKQAARYAVAIEHGLEDCIAPVASIGAVIGAVATITADQFQRATAHQLARHPSLRAIGWNPIVTDAARFAHESAVRADGFPDYAITERTPEGELVRAGRRSRYVVVQYIAPHEGNEDAIGFDVFSEARRRRAIERAIATGETSLTAQISLVQEQDEPGFLVFVPVYGRDGDVGSAAHGAAPPLPAGFAVGVFHAAAIVDLATQGIADDGFALTIDDVTDSVAALYRGGGLGDAANASEESLRFEQTVRFEQGGRIWQVRFVPGDEVIAQQRGNAPLYVLLTGLVVTALAVTYLMSLLRVNSDLTREIERRHEAEEQRRILDAKLQEAQKVESLGLFAGGAAHEFNNLLTGIIGNTELALETMEPEAEERFELEQIRQAATRAADLTGQMLAYTGSKYFKPKRFDLSRLFHELVRFLEASSSPGGTLRFELSPDPLIMEGDPRQVRQLIVNLVTNAMEAFEGGPGVVTITTGRRVFDRAALADARLAESLAPGSHLFLQVADDGRGMSAHESARVFDPFFTTRFKGRGLGLAVVMGIVRGHGGAIWLDSNLAKGSTFTIAFPAPADDDAIEESTTA